MWREIVPDQQSHSWYPQGWWLPSHQPWLQVGAKEGEEVQYAAEGEESVKYIKGGGALNENSVSQEKGWSVEKEMLWTHFYALELFIYLPMPTKEWPSQLDYSELRLWNVNDSLSLYSPSGDLSVFACNGDVFCFICLNI